MPAALRELVNSPETPLNEATVKDKPEPVIVSQNLNDIKYTLRLKDRWVNPHLIRIVYSNLKDELVCWVNTHLHTAIEEVMTFNTPDRFVLETIPSKRKRAKGRIERSDSRPTYTLLRPDAIRRTMGISSNAKEGFKKRPHERRRHFRTYKSDRYKSAKGKTVVIPATWIGPSEAEIGNKRYRVCLEV